MRSDKQTLRVSVRPGTSGNPVASSGRTDVGSPADVVERRSSDHDNREVKHPVRCRAECVGRGTDAKADDFRGLCTTAAPSASSQKAPTQDRASTYVEPGHAKPSDSEERVEYEEEHR